MLWHAPGSGFSLFRAEESIALIQDGAVVTEDGVRPYPRWRSRHRRRGTSLSKMAQSSQKTEYILFQDGRCSIFSRSPSESGRLYYVRMRTGDLVNFAVLNCSPQRALRKRMRALNFYCG
ncbi:hypothetical protein NDU88_000028 [Pleurodeles waltl]|uniref:Uncharacterized protein n=1 Tax=Pleurodeles waltl TaxID=8319 RepID=A0AAV7WK23_PLEWA|nr:hypothetical protein NDU88_000028 [Pleurodeles waltl]